MSYPCNSWTDSGKDKCVGVCLEVVAGLEVADDCSNMSPGICYPFMRKLINFYCEISFGISVNFMS